MQSRVLFFRVCLCVLFGVRITNYVHYRTQKQKTSPKNSAGDISISGAVFNGYDAHAYAF